MLQETQISLMEENAKMTRLFNVALKPTELKRTLNVRQVEEKTTDLEEKLGRCNSVVTQCTRMLIQEQRKQQSQNGYGNSTTDIGGIEYFEGQPVQMSLTELKRLRSEVVRLRHRLRAMETTNNNGTTRNTSEESFKRETADAQVIRSLRAQVEQLNDDIMKNSPRKDKKTTVVDSAVYAKMQLQIRQLLRREQQQASELMLVRNKSVSLGNELNGLRANVSEDIKRAADMYTRKQFEMEHLSKQHLSLQTAYDALAPYANRIRLSSSSSSSSSSPRSSPTAPSAAPSAAPLDASRGSILAQGVSSLQAQLSKAHDRNNSLERLVNEARGECKAMRDQYVNRVGEHRQETRALLQSQGDRSYTRTRNASLRLLARRVLYALHTAPVRRAFLKWEGVARATGRATEYKRTYGRVQVLEQSNIELSKRLRREQTNSKSLEGQLASQRSVYQVSNALNTYGRNYLSSSSTFHRPMSTTTTASSRVVALEEELERERQANLRSTSEAEKWKAAEKRARESENIIRDQLSIASSSLDYGSVYSNTTPNSPRR